MYQIIWEINHGNVNVANRKISTIEVHWVNYSEIDLEKKK